MDAPEPLTPRGRSAPPDIPPAPEELTEEHLKLLYLISKYSHTSQPGNPEKDRWIRKLPLLVLIYEGIVAKVFDYDYAPASEVLGTRRLYLNITQEGRDDIDDLRELNEINGLKLSSNGFSTVTAYQLSQKGLKTVTKLSEAARKEVDELVCDKDHGGELFQVFYNEKEKEFYLKSPKGPARKSSITDCEDVSYVSSPFLPMTLRHPTSRATSSNAAKAWMARKGVSTIRDDLSEALVLGHVKLLVGEFIPANLIVALNDKLGSTERVKGGLFTALSDTQPDSTNFEAEAGLTSVQILDFELARYLNFEAEVWFPEEEGVVQVEQFGVHCRDDGTVVCGLEIDAIMANDAAHVSLDLLSRVLVDIHVDSSRILDSVISNYQRSLLDLLFVGDASSRDKFNVILAKTITPKLSAAKYMDKEENENELKQVLGDTHSAHDLSMSELLVIGRHGILVVGDKGERHAATLVAYQTLMARSIFISNFYMRLFGLGETLKSIRTLISSYERNPNSIPKIRSMLSEASQQAVHMGEILRFLHESLDDMGLPSMPEDDAAGKRLFEILAVSFEHKNLLRRVKDLDKNIASLTNELGTKPLHYVISETQMFRVQEALQANTKNLEDVFRAGERQSNSLEIMQVILSGTLAFEILDRITGEWSVIDTEWGANWIGNPLIKSTPGVWFIINLALWGVIGYCLTIFMSYLSEKGAGVLTIRHKANLPINLEALRALLTTKPLAEEEVDQHLQGRVKKCSWNEPASAVWQGRSPKIEISYDESYGFLLNVYIQVDKAGRQPLVESALKETFFEDLRRAKVLVSEDVGSSLAQM